MYGRDTPDGTRARATALFGGLPARAPVIPEPAAPPEPAPAPVSDPDSRGRRSGEARPLPWYSRWRLALGERLPLWVSLRCGAEPRTLAALAVLLVVAVGFAGHHFWSGRPEAVRVPAAEPAGAAGPVALPGAAEPAPPPSPGPVRPAGDRAVVVDVAGKVRKPGIRRLPAGSRVADALEAAGGVRPGTDTTGLNRARVLTDGEQIVVGGPAAPPVSGGGAAGVPGPAARGAAAGPVSLSTATLEQLDGLPGVGPVLAQRILEHRDRQGGFTSVDQLREVNGIGDRRFADIQPLVRP